MREEGSIDTMGSLFAIVAYGLYWVCTKFGLPQPVLWLCGAILLIILLLFVARQIGSPMHFSLH